MQSVIVFSFVRFLVSCYIFVLTYSHILCVYVCACVFYIYWYGMWRERICWITGGGFVLLQDYLLCELHYKNRM